MSERYIEIRNWDRFQHKDIWRKSGGRPPWIKNYTALLHDDDYMALSWAQRGILHGLWLMYAQSEDTSSTEQRECVAHARDGAANWEAWAP